MWSCNRTFDRLYYRERHRTGGLGFSEMALGMVDETSVGTRPADEYTVNGFRFKFGDSVRDLEKANPRRKVCMEIAVRVEGGWQAIYGPKRNWMGEDAYGALSRKESPTWAECRQAVRVLKKHLQEKARLGKAMGRPGARGLPEADAALAQPVIEERLMS